MQQGPSVLARWIALRQVVSFEWQAQTWLPLFQFDRRDMSIHPELAHWFARPNSSLEALRTDRFAIEG